MTDEELIRLYQARDPRAVEETKARYGAYCAAIARRLLTDARDVEECLSDCAMAVWNAIPPARPQHFQGYLGAVVRNRALLLRRRRGRQDEIRGLGGAAGRGGQRRLSLRLPYLPRF